MWPHIGTQQTTAETYSAGFGLGLGFVSFRGQGQGQGFLHRHAPPEHVRPRGPREVVLRRVLGQRPELRRVAHLARQQRRQRLHADTSYQNPDASSLAHRAIPSRGTCPVLSAEPFDDR